MSTDRHTAGLRYPLGVVALVVAALLLHVAVGQFVATTAITGFPMWLPIAGSLGETVLVYEWGVMRFGFALVPAGAFWLGAQYERTNGWRRRKSRENGTNAV
ncbi:hypothetical protein [Halarchaeum sp. P4]|uniref:hypothetical protein n=1 Tax=Halarchaeum sp. P4 TaxID=3421639 RepID=UPI003EC12DBA